MTIPIRQIDRKKLIPVKLDVSKYTGALETDECARYCAEHGNALLDEIDKLLCGILLIITLS